MYSSDPYKILQVGRNATRVVIEASYKALAKEYHPDVAGGNSEKMQLLNWAYDLLRNEQEKRKWDFSHPENPSREKPPERPYSYNRNEGRGEPKTERKPPKSKNDKGQDFNRANVRTNSANRFIVAVVVMFVGLFYLLLAFDYDKGNNMQPTVRTATGKVAGGQATAMANFWSGQTAEARAEATWEVLFSSSVSLPRGPSGAECLPFNEVKGQHVGLDLCVFGEVVSTSNFPFEDVNTGQIRGRWQVYFTQDTGPTSSVFRVIADDIYYEIPAGECVLVEGSIQRFNDAYYPYMDVSEDAEIYSLDAKYC